MKYLISLITKLHISGLELIRKVSCTCLSDRERKTHGYPELEFSKFDSLSVVYFEISHYVPETYLKIDSLAKNFVSKLVYDDTYYEETNSKGVFIQSFEYIKKKEFHDFVKSLDKYIYK